MAITQLTKIDNVPIAVGGPYTDSNKAETYSIQENKWTLTDAYPFHDSINSFAAVMLTNATLIIGGNINNGQIVDGIPLATAIVARYDWSGWSLDGRLHGKRFGHSASVIGGKMFVLAGNNIVNFHN